MTDLLRLRVLTPQRQILDTETPWVTIPGVMGELGILPRHVPIITAIDSGVLQYESAGKPRLVAVHYGYAQLQADTVTVLSEMAEPAAEIDLARARQAELRAKEALGGLVKQQSAEASRMKKYDSKLQRSLVRQRAGG